LTEGSLRALARRCECSHEAIRKHVRDFRERFGFSDSGAVVTGQDQFESGDDCSSPESGRTGKLIQGSSCASIVIDTVVSNGPLA
jgi:hypothetical protein